LAAAAVSTASAHEANHTGSERVNGSEGMTGTYACAENPVDSGNSNEGAAAKSRIERGFLIQFLANEEFMAKLDEVKALLSNKMPNGTFESVFETLMNEFIDRHSPKKRTQRREIRKEQSKQAGPAPKKQP
jgi:hypothetical protein